MLVDQSEALFLTRYMRPPLASGNGSSLLTAEVRCLLCTCRFVFFVVSMAGLSHRMSPANAKNKPLDVER